MGFQLTPKTEGFFYGIQLPVISEAGASQIQKFELKFKRVSRSKINQLQKQQEALNQGDYEVDSLERDVDYVMEIAEGWRYVQGADGQEIPFNRENVHIMLDTFPNAAGEIVKSFFESTLGGGAKRKN